MKEQFLGFHHEPQNAARSFLPEKDREENSSQEYFMTASTMEGFI
jgi:hypothetical protein